MKRIAKAHWTGKLKDGKGTLTTQSGILKNTNYSYKTRFEGNDNGTNPEELLAAAHAGCFTMQVSATLTSKGFDPVYLDTEAELTLENSIITGITLKITGSVPGIKADEFNTITEEAKKNCIISKALSVFVSAESKLADS
jgi:osmotically inducible protein OsmC